MNESTGGVFLVVISTGQLVKLLRGLRNVGVCVFFWVSNPACVILSSGQKFRCRFRKVCWLLMLRPVHISDR